MALYRNSSRFAAIVTIKVSAVPKPDMALTIGVESAKKVVEAGVGVHDLAVGPGESIELGENVDAQFLAARSAL